MLSIVQVIKRGLSSPNCCFARLAKIFLKHNTRIKESGDDFSPLAKIIIIRNETSAKPGFGRPMEK